jgi:hypothetical protein
VRTLPRNDELDAVPGLAGLGSAGEALLGRVLDRIRRWQRADDELDEQLQAIDDLTAILRQQALVEPPATEASRAA